MKKFIRKLVPNALINYGKHLPTAILANIKYGFPSKGMTVIGVTGTDGKTTTTNMIYRILKTAGKRVSMISSINAAIGNRILDTGFHVTNPDSVALQKIIKEAKKMGSEYLVLETTSQGLAQFRNWGINFSIGVITNVTPEHLDYHKNFDSYLKAKAALIKGAKLAILNRDDKNFARLSKMTKGKVVSVSLKREADLNLKKFPLKLKIPGQYNLSNALQAAAVCINLGIDWGVIRKVLAKFKSLSGRMETVKNNRGVSIVIDFAHTPNALENALKTLREKTSGRLISVFGCAAERDTQKRPVMGKISAGLADITILTDEDPRYENSEKIIDEIAQGCYKAGAKDQENLFKRPNRTKAISLAIALARKGDTVGIFGKGHEQSMNYQGKELPWSDKKAVLKALEE